MDRRCVRAVSGVRADGLLSGILRRVLRRPALRDERGVADDRAGAYASGVPQLVPPRLPIRVRDVPLRWRRVMTSGSLTADAAALRSAFADDVREYLLRSPRQLPSKYFYDELGSALFEAICRLPWYRITRSETMLLRRHA